MKPKVSIILPTYNVSKWLDDCCVSILNQTLSEWEAIFINDGSTDDSLQILEHYQNKDQRIKVFSQSNQGQGEARNLGVDKSSGEFLFFLDSDDVIAPNALEKAYNKAIEANADIVIGDFFEFTDQKLNSFPNAPSSQEFNKIFAHLPDVFERKDIKDELLFYDSLYFMVVWMKLFRSEVWKSNNIKAPMGISMGEDFMTVKKMCFISKRITTTSDIFVYYRKRPNSSTTKRSVKAFGIFKSYSYTLNMYQNMTMPEDEFACMHRAYLRWYNYHLKVFTPIRYWFKFYVEILNSFKHWQLQDIYNHTMKKEEIACLEILRTGNKRLFLRYLFNVFTVKYIILKILLKLLKYTLNFVPNIFIVKLIKFLNYLSNKNSFPGKGIIIKFIRYIKITSQISI